MFRAIDGLADDRAGNEAAQGSGTASHAGLAGPGEAAAYAAGAMLAEVDRNFAAQIATAVWIGNLSDAAAREAILSYAIACQMCDRAHLIRLRQALLAEYEHCRERQDLVS